MLTLGLILLLNASDFSKGIDALNKKNYKTALKYLKKACTNGENAGCYNLGVMYTNGVGVRQNISKAKYYSQKACDGGNSKGCYNVGSAYANQNNWYSAKKYFKKACDGGVSKGCKNYKFLSKEGY